MSTDADRIKECSSRVCKKCQKELPVTEFYFRKEKDNYRSCCKKCKSVRTKQEIIDSLKGDTKVCTHCKVEKNKTEFQKAGGGKWLQPYCKPCDAVRKRKHLENNFDKVVVGRKKYYQENKAQILKKQKKYIDDNKDDILKRRKAIRQKDRDKINERHRRYGRDNRAELTRRFRERRHANPEYYKEKGRQMRANRTPEQIAAKKLYDKEYREKGREKIIAWKKKNADKIREQRRVWGNTRAATDIQYRLKRNLRTRIRCALKPNNAYKIDKSENLLGCKIDFYKNYLESLFTNGMTWDLFMTGDIEIDHIKPCVKFDLRNEDDQRACFNYKNTQPLWWYDNMKKGAKYQEQKSA